MPELPEVETTRLGLVAAMEGVRIDHAVVRERRMRQPISRALPRCVEGLTVRALHRRAKYLLIDCGTGTLIVHLGMSGRLWLVDSNTPPEKHDHFDLVLSNGKTVRLRDPRRFGCVLWVTGDVMQHKLLASLGPEPLSADFNGATLYNAIHKRGSAIKLVIMDSHVVVGVGNIYASEALFRSGIRPQTSAGRVSLARFGRLVVEVRRVLAMAIKKGGSTLKDFSRSDGEPGSFQLEYRVYDRAGLPCRVCATPIRRLIQGQRSTFFCPRCQT